MNKLSKGIIVSGLGVALLLGTGGSLALWNVSAESQAGSIATGDLNLAVATSGQTWEVATGTDTWAAIPDISTFRMVPGDKVRLTQPMDVTLVGDNMKAELTVDTSEAIVSGDATAADLITVTTAWTNPPAGVTMPTLKPASENTWVFADELGGTETFTQQVIFAFSSTATERVGALSTIDLSKTEFVLAQTYENAPA
ncbi:hypothetical protein GCM10022198_23280 [Klugiella xanthotipulae]|uniref:Alternate signal-mediated exported protein n=1 Tax=Klugiella xanthotipulae TaxID=244735 RepID=A0A543I5S2_9MICO|nr:alternate-type signal peptide domain-containing protein [Klugiella xanthotipulae]TQM65945.1 alternate signal-mediated exported protein [Klugiella xanthotipulae]